MQKSENNSKTPEQGKTKAQVSKTWSCNSAKAVKKTYQVNYLIAFQLPMKKKCNGQLHLSVIFSLMEKNVESENLVKLEFDTVPRLVTNSLTSMTFRSICKNICSVTFFFLVVL